MAEILRMRIQGNPEYIMIAKMAVGSAVSIEGCNIDCVEDIKMAVGEACKIVTCHGAAKWSANYEIIVEKEEKKLTISIEDDNAAGSGEEKINPPCLDCPKEGDLGVQVIKSLMDQVHIEKSDSGCKVIKMVKEKC